MGVGWCVVVTGMCVWVLGIVQVVLFLYIFQKNILMDELMQSEHAKPILKIDY